MRVPKFDPPEVTEKPQATWVTQIRQYELITPLFGGGVNPTEVDPVTVVRATEIRGHLRFWWRATQGGKFGDDLARMKQAEDELFGRAAVEGRSGPSQVQVVITKWNVMGTDQPFEVVAGKSDGLRQKPKIQSRKDSKVPPYAAFPLQPEQKDAKIGMATKAVTIGVSFVFEIVFPKTHQIDIEAALWAWESFGGLGARTRRGFGALQLLSINNVPVPLPEASQLEPYFQKKLAQYVIEGIWPTDVPHLHRTISEQTKRYLKTTQASQNPIDCWKDLIEKLKSFRQKRNPRGEGRSKWPEPDEIRRLTDRKSPDHRTPLSEIEKFPQIGRASCRERV